LTQNEVHGRHCSLFSIEREFPKLDVAGSIPVSRSFVFSNLRTIDRLSGFLIYSIKNFILSKRFRSSLLQPFLLLRLQSLHLRIDVLVTNAGIDFLGAIEEQNQDDYRALFEVNFFGAVALLRLVLPGMRRRKRGTIINLSSMDGMASLPANGYYSSSKFALEGLTEALWREIEPLGLRTLLVEPGSFRTGIAQRTKLSGTPIDAYAATSGAFRSMMNALSPDLFPGDPIRAAAVIYPVVKSGRLRHWVILGSDAHRRIGMKIDMLRAEYEEGKDIAFSTDYPDNSERAVL